MLGQAQNIRNIITQNTVEIPFCHRAFQVIFVIPCPMGKQPHRSIECSSFGDSAVTSSRFRLHPASRWAEWSIYHLEKGLANILWIVALYQIVSLCPGSVKWKTCKCDVLRLWPNHCATQGNFPSCGRCDWQKWESVAQFGPFVSATWSSRTARRRNNNALRQKEEKKKCNNLRDGARGGEQDPTVSGRPPYLCSAFVELCMRCMAPRRAAWERINKRPTSKGGEKEKGKWVARLSLGFLSNLFPSKRSWCTLSYQSTCCISNYKAAAAARCYVRDVEYNISETCRMWFLQITNNEKHNGIVDVLFEKKNPLILLTEILEWFWITFNWIEFWIVLFNENWICFNVNGL